MNNATDMVLHLLSDENCVDETVSRNIIDAGDMCQFGVGTDEFPAALSASAHSLSFWSLSHSGHQFHSGSQLARANSTACSSDMA